MLNLSERNGANETTQGIRKCCKTFRQKKKSLPGQKTNSWHCDKEKYKQVQDSIIIGYTPIRVDGLQMLADYNKNPFDTKAAKMTFDDIYEEWSKRKYPTVSDSNVEGYTAVYKTCSSLYNKILRI